MSKYHKVLGVPETATKEEIKKAYRVLSMKYHPDKTNNDPIKTLEFMTIKSAYEYLTNKVALVNQECYGEVVYSEFDDNGDCWLTFRVNRVLFIVPAKPLYFSYFWTCASSSGGRVKMYKRDLVSVNYKFILQYHTYDGPIIHQEVELTPPLTRFQKFVQSIKNLFK